MIDDHLFDVVTLIKTVSRSYLARFKIEKAAILSSIPIQVLGINPERYHHLKIKNFHQKSSAFAINTQQQALIKKEQGTRQRASTHALIAAFQTISVHPRVSASQIITYFISMENTSPK